MTNKKIGILGTVGNSRRVAPFDDASWDLWVCSPGNSQASAPARITEWYELHSLVDCLGIENASWWPNYVEWLNKNSDKFPIWMQETNEIVPAAKPFPRRELLDRWGPSSVRTNWFTSSIAWMIAFAIQRGAEEIGIFGVDMAATEEHYSSQKAGCLRFFEIARELGIKITVPLESTLSFGSPLYGYAEQSRPGRALIVREQELNERIAGLTAQAHHIQGELCFFRGALEQVKFDRRTFVSGLDDAELDEAPPFTAEPAVPATIEAAAATLLPPAQRTTPPPTAEDFAGSPDAAALLNGSGKAHVAQAVIAASAQAKAKRRRGGGARQRART
jgi:hypothetical protein